MKTICNKNNQQRVIHFFVSMTLVFSMCMGVLFQGINNNVVHAAEKVTEEQLYMLLPKYLVEDICDPYYDKCRGYCEDAIGTVSKADELISSYLYCFKSGSKVLVKEAGSMVGITSSNFDSMNKQVAGELLKSYFSVKDSWISDATEICDDYKYVTKTYGILSSGLKDEFKAINKTRKYIVYTDEQIDDIFKNTEITGKILGKIGDAQDAADVLITILELNQLELESIDRLIISTRVDTDLQKGLIEIRNDMTDDLTGYLIRNYLNDKALDKLAKVLTKATAGHISGTATLVAGLIADLTYTSYTKYNPSVDDIVYTALLEGYYDVINGAQDKIMSKFGQGTATVDDIETYKVIYNFRVSTLKFWMQRCEKLAKKSDSRLSNRLNIYGESLVTDFNYDLYLKSCLTKANKDYDAGLITISNENVTKYTPNGNVIDETYDSKESILAKFTVIQTKYKPNVGQTWTGSYNGCIQCCGFAQLVFNNLFGYNLSGYYGDRRYMIRDEEKAIKVGQLIGSNVTTDNVKAMFSKAQLGDFVQMDGATYGQHSAIFVSADDTGVTLYDCNSKPHGETTDCLINQWKITWANWVKWYGTAPSGRQNGISVYHASNYAEIYGDGSDLFYDDSVNFVIENGILKKYNGWQAHVVIPDEVTEIGEGAFKNNDTMISIEIPDTVTKIGNEAFYGCSSLVAIYIPDSVEEIGTSVFVNCTNLVSVHITENSKYSTLSYRIFDGCSKLNSINLSDNLTKIEASAFNDCTSLDAIIIPDSVTSINNYAFNNCTSASELKLSQNLIDMGYSVFNNCDSIESVEIPKSLKYCQRELYTVFVTIFHPGPFGGCDNLKNVTFEEGITQIPQYLFADCNGIEEIELPDTVTSIGTGAFMSCPFLRKVEIPNTLTYIGTSAFASCMNLEEIAIPEALISLGGNSFYDCDKISEVHISDRLENVGFMTDSRVNGPFSNCDGIKKVTFGEITSIPGNLFKDCTGIEEITIPNSCSEIGGYAFQNCTKLKKVILSNSLEEIAYQQFNGCISLEEIEIPDSVTYLGSAAFSDCTSLKSITIPDSVESIGASLFNNCTSLTEIQLPNSIKSIGDSCFYKCSALKKIDIPLGVEKIDENAFAYCEKMTEITIPEGVKTIGFGAFQYDSSLTAVSLPNSLQSLGNKSFQYCKALNTVNFGAGITSISDYAFYENASLETVVLPQQITQIGAFSFGNCTKLTDITINRNVNEIKTSTFSYPEKLTIHGVAGSYAETFANENGFSFEQLLKITSAIDINENNVEIGKGNTLQLKAIITPEDSADMLTWESDNNLIATVTSSGLVEGVSGGKATITARSGDEEAKCVVNVYEPVSSVDISPYSYEGHPGEQIQLTASIYPSTAAYKDVEWSTEDKNIATVDKK